MNGAMLKNTMKNGLRNAVLPMVAALVLGACVAHTDGRGADKDGGASAMMTDRVTAYNCDDGRTVDVTLSGAERVQLKIGGAAADLRAVRAASGAKFESADGGIVFWSKGNEALIETTGKGGKKVRLNCGIRAQE